MGDTTLSIIIVNWNTRDITRRCLQSIRERVHEITYQVVLIDNASTDGSVEMIQSEFPEYCLISNKTNLGFGAACNQGMRAAKGRFFLLLNSDTVLIDDSIQRLVNIMDAAHDLGIIGCRLLFEDLTLQHSCFRFPSLALALIEELVLYRLLPRRKQGELLLAGYWPHDQARDVDWISGALMLLRREVFNETGGFDQRLFMYGEDMEWCRRVRDSGWRIAFVPDCQVIHLEHKSADIKYGDDRIDLCHKRLYDIYGRQSGIAALYALFGIKTVGAMIRFIYFGSRARMRKQADPYLNEQAKFHRRSLMYHLHVLLPIGLTVRSAELE